MWEVEYWIKMLTNTWNYKARWTLKVTWVHAPAYPAQKTLRVSGPVGSSLGTIWKSDILES